MGRGWLGRQLSEREYYVEWRIDILADTPEEAALKALQIQRDPESSATYFHVSRQGKSPRGPEFGNQFKLINAQPE